MYLPCQCSFLAYCSSFNACKDDAFFFPCGTIKSIDKSMRIESKGDERVRALIFDDYLNLIFSFVYISEVSIMDVCAGFRQNVCSGLMTDTCIQYKKVLNISLYFK